MLIVSRRVLPMAGRSRSLSGRAVLLVGALFVLLGAAALAAPSALAGSPATVTVRVLGPAPGYKALIPPTEVTTTTAPVVNDGEPTHSCSGTSAAGALQLATSGNWAGRWYEGEANGYLVETIDGTTPPPASSYWSFWLDNREATKGICESELEPGGQVLFFPECFGECPAPFGSTHVLGIEVPPTVEVGQPIGVTVVSYNTAGERSPAAGVNVGGWGSSTTTDSEGKATLTFPGDETYTLRATGATGESPLAVPGEALVCVHAGDDGECGTSRPAGGSLPVSSSSSGGGTVGEGAPYTGAYAVVAAVTGIHEGHVYPRAKAPRVLAGTVSAHASVTSISLRLRRSYRGRCWAYNGSRERVEHVRCGQGGFFQVASGGDSFSYLLPSRLPPGRYVLDIAATDSAGDHAPLDRGSSRVVFYVK
jgi:hypothetical protein